MLESLNQVSVGSERARTESVQAKYENLPYYTIEGIGEGLHNTISNFPANMSIAEAVLSDDKLNIGQIKSEHKLIKHEEKDVAEGYMFRAQNSNGQLVILSPGMLGDFSDTFVKTHLQQLQAKGYDVFILNHSGLKKNQNTVRYVTNQNYASNQTDEVDYESSTGSHSSTISAWRRDVPAAIKALGKDYKEIKLITHSTGGGLVSAMFANYFDKTNDGSTTAPWSLKSEEINKITAWVNLAGATYGSSTMKMPHQYRDEYFTGETKTTAELWEYAINYLFGKDAVLAVQHLKHDSNVENAIDILTSIESGIEQLDKSDQNIRVLVARANYRVKELQRMFTKIDRLTTNPETKKSLSRVNVTTLIADHDEYLTAVGFENQMLQEPFTFSAETDLASWGADNVFKIADLPQFTTAQRQKLVDLGFICEEDGVLMNHDMLTLQTEQILEALQVYTYSANNTNFY
ncbi:MAG: hypothetical protein WCK98_08310 [bacterium]